MTTNIDELIADLYEQRMISDSEVVALRSQQKRIGELEREAESTISQLRQVQVRMNYWHDRTGEAEAKLSAIYKAVADDLEFLQYRNTMAMRIRLLSILDTVKDAPCNCSVETRTVCDKCQRPASPTMQAELDAAVMRGFEDAPAQEENK